MSQIKFSPSQEKAVTHVDGPMMVLAGPGSGKTAVITGRTRYLIEEAKVDPDSILVITFTKAAALEMRDRFVKMMGSAMGVRFSTFHSVFFTIIRLSYNIDPSQIITENVAGNFIRDKARAMQMEEASDKDFVKNILGEISLVKSEDININNYYSLHCPTNSFREIYNSYNEFMKKSRLIDFDDMMLVTKRLFTERKDVLEAWQNKYKYILIDEFQDVSKLQYDLVRMMAEPNNNIFVVGDDDQSIYRFRGARPEIMLGFPKDYKNAKQVVLSENYRSTKKIVKFCGKIITKNKKRFKKDITAVSEEGKEPEVKKFPDRNKEDNYIIANIMDAHKRGLPYSEIAVIYRTNLAARPFAERLMEYDIPYVMKESAPNIYDHFIAKDFLAYLEIAEGNRSQENLLRIMNKPVRYLSRESLVSATVDLPDKPRFVSFLRWKDFYKGRSWMAIRIDDLAGDIRQLSKMSPYPAIHYLRNIIGYDNYLKDYAKERGIEYEELRDVEEELAESAKPFNNLAEWKAHIEEVTEKLREKYKMDKNSGDAVAVLTMHGSKGLEYKTVFVPECVDGMIPYKKAIKDSDIEEERRLFYVAATRAKKELYITYPEKLFGREKDPSPFLRGLL